MLGELLELLPAAGKQSFGQKGESRSWTTGLYAEGPFRGLRRATLDFPASTRLVCKAVRAVDPQAFFSSVALLQDVKSEPHKDKNNLPSAPSLVFALWVEGGSQECESSLPAGPRFGELLDVGTGPVSLQGHRTHLTLDWEYQEVRCCLLRQGFLQAEALDSTFLPEANRVTLSGLRNSSRTFDSTLGYPGEGPPWLAFWPSFIVLGTCFLRPPWAPQCS